MPVDPSPTEGQEPENTNVAPADTSADQPAGKPADQPTPDANDPAASSTADGEEPSQGSEDAKPRTIMDAVDAALAGGKEQADPASSTGREKKGTEKPKSDADEAEGDGDEDGEQPPFHEHPRWKELVAERDELREKIIQAEEGVQAVERIAGFLNENNLSNGEFEQLLKIGALMKNDPVQALQALTPYYNQLLQVTGYALPQDLQEQVDAGYITEDIARQYSRERANRHIAEQRASMQSQRHEQTEQSREREQAAMTLGETASEWERRWEASDPDYSKKATRVLERVQLAMHNEGVPTTPEAVRELCERERKFVENELRQHFLPKPAPVHRRTPEDGANPGRQGDPAPKDLLGVIDQVLGAG